jgi:hypothetical protein
VISRFIDVTWPLRSPDLTAPDFFCGVIWKVKYTALAFQTYMHSDKKIREEIAQNLRRNTTRSYSQFVNSCAPVHSGGCWPPESQCTQKVKQCKNKLSTIVKF